MPELIRCDEGLVLETSASQSSICVCVCLLEIVHISSQAVFYNIII